MLFQKSIISFVTAIALASSVSASSIAARGASPQCPQDLTPYCCGKALAFNALPTSPQNDLPSLAPNLDQSKQVGEDCTAPRAQGCPDGDVPLCCSTTVTVDNLDVVINCQAPNNANDDATTNTNDHGAPNKGINH